jgi:hypothetical protein
MSDDDARPPIPDPSVLTTEQMLLGVENLEKLTAALRTGEVGMIGAKLAALHREMSIIEDHRLELQTLREAHRLELKAGDEKALSTAMIAAEKAVQAALAAAEKARDQQTIASQLATTKAENAFTEQLRQQKDSADLRFDTVITGVNDTKSLLGELRAEKRGGQEQVADSHVKSSNVGLWVGIAIAAAGVLGTFILGVAGIIITLLLTTTP